MDPRIHITGTGDDTVYVVRAWGVEMPPELDWTPRYKTRAISVRRVVGVWVDGRLWRAGVTGPYRLKSGQLSVDMGGSGSPDFRPMYDQTEHVSYMDGRPDSFTREQLPEWIWDFTAEHGPVL